MLRALYSAAAGMESQQMNLDVISNNLANVNTTGFKGGRAEFQDLLYQNINTAAIIPSTGKTPELCEACPNPTEAQAANTARLTHIRNVKAWPALIRFFHSKATAGGPAGRPVTAF